VLAVEYRETRFEAELLVLLADDGQAQVVEGGYGQATGVVLPFPFAGEPGHPFLHLPGGLVGKSHGRDAVGRITTFGDQVVDLLGDYAGLATARAGQHEQGGTDVLHRLELAGIEIFHRSFRRKREQAAGHGRWYCRALYTRGPVHAVTGRPIYLGATLTRYLEFSPSQSFREKRSVVKSKAYRVACGVHGDSGLFRIRGLICI